LCVTVGKWRQEKEEARGRGREANWSVDRFQKTTQTLSRRVTGGHKVKKNARRSVEKVSKGMATNFGGGWVYEKRKG